MKECYYSVVGVPYTATSEEIKKAYRVKALQWHPDKARDISEMLAKERFQILQEAYETLSNPQERAWYDGHKTQILAGDSDRDSPGEEVSVWKFFSRSCFTQFDDSPKGFYTVYRDLFERIDVEDLKWTDKPRPRSGFGNSEASWADVSAFYRDWLDYNTRLPFRSVEPWRLSDAPNRDIRRIMQLENKKAISDAKREYNESIRNLVAWIKNRDPRVLEYQIKESKRMAEEQERKMELLAKAEARAREERDANKARELARQEHIKREKKRLRAQGQHFCDSDEEDPVPAQPATQTFACEPCRKSFKTAAMLLSHEQSKKHQQVLKQLLSECRSAKSASMAAQPKQKGPSSSPKSAAHTAESPATSEEEHDQVQPEKEPEVYGKNEQSGSESDRREEGSDESSSREEESEGSSEEEASEGSGDGTPSEADYMQIFGKSRVRHGVTSPPPPKVVDFGSLTESEGESKPVATVKAPKKPKRRAGAKPAEQWRCLVCQNVFPSRNQLMKHVNAEGHAALKSVLPRKGR